MALKLIDRAIEPALTSRLVPGKVVVLFGPRRVGKTVLIQQVLSRYKLPHLLLNGDDLAARELLERPSIVHYRDVLSPYRLLVIDEAQQIPDIGIKLKLMVDHLPDLAIWVSGSSALDLEQETGEPLTGRMVTFNLFPLSEREHASLEKPQERKDRLLERLIYGCYPELIQAKSPDEKREYLEELANAYLLKDLLAYEGIRKSEKLWKLLRLVAFQIGQEISLDELGKQLGLSKNTVEKYLDLLQKSFVLHRIGGFSRNLRKEVSKSHRWYFLDNGLRNILVSNLNSPNQRSDMGMLWENYAVSERLKFQHDRRLLVNNYFWRTYDQQEIDWVEERDGQLFAYEFKWARQDRLKAPVAWQSAYPDAHFAVIHPENLQDWVSGKSTE